MSVIVTRALEQASHINGSGNCQIERRATDRLLVAAFGLIAFALPLEAVGFHVSGYLVSLSTLVGIFLAAYLAAFGRHRKWPLFFMMAFGAWSLVTVAARFPPTAYVPSLVAFLALAFPIVSAALYRLRAAPVLAAFRAGFYFTCALVALEVIAQLALPSGFEMVQQLLLPHTRTHDFLGFTRVKGLMLEPAHLAIYMSLVYVVFDLLKKPRDSIMMQQWLAVVVILLTMSLSGIMILAAYVATKWSKSLLWAVLRTRRYSWDELWRALVLFAFVALLMGFNWDLVSDVSTLFLERALGIFTVLMSAEYVGSIGSRANTLPVMVGYWVDHWPWGSLAGTGYGNFEEWLVQTYGYLGSMSSFARGELNSIIAVVGISTGAIGLVLFTLLLLAVVARPFRRDRFQLLAFLFMFQLAYGYLIFYFFWHCILVLVIAALDRQRQLGASFATPGDPGFRAAVAAEGIQDSEDPAWRHPDHRGGDGEKDNRRAKIQGRKR